MDLDVGLVDPRYQGPPRGGGRKTTPMFLVMREMQIETTMRAHFPSTRMAKMKNIDSNKC